MLDNYGYAHTRARNARIHAHTHTHAHCMLDNYSYAHTPTHTYTRTQTRTHTHMRIACWITKVKHARTHNMHYVLPLHCNSGCKKAPHCRVLRTLPVFCLLTSSNCYFGYGNTKLPQFYHASYPNNWSTIGTSGNLFLEALSASRFCRIYVRPPSVRPTFFLFLTP